MGVSEILVTVIAAMSIPSAVCSFFIRRLEKKMDKKETETDKKEEARAENTLLLIKAVGASLALGEATARAVQRIPDANCNGDMHQALDYAEKIKHEQKDFLYEQSVKNVI